MSNFESKDLYEGAHVSKSQIPSTSTRESIAYTINFASLLASIYCIYLAIESIQWHGGENFALLILCLFGFSTSFVQVVIFLPITYLCTKLPMSHAKRFRVHWLLYFAVLLPVATLSIIMTGLVIAETNRAK